MSDDIGAPPFCNDIGAPPFCNDIGAPPFAVVSEASIGVLIDRFYDAIRMDAVLGPIFDAAIPAGEWPRHLATMRGFWSSVMLASGRYSGNPVAVHRAVAGLDRNLFPRWLGLFEATAGELFTAEAAALFVEKARRIATSLQLAVYHRLDAPPGGMELPSAARNAG